ncbi:sulfotransferase 1A1-like isoform X1 [Dreissena polymorpha]|nr:sulfotransferase 1A1-like isoform X1 [Dreissena polymorpha]
MRVYCSTVSVIVVSVLSKFNKMTTKINLTTPNGIELEYCFAKGIYFRASTLEHLTDGDLSKQVENVQNLPIRDDDVYLVTFPKSGTHWLWEIVCMLRKGKSEYEKDVKEVAFLDFKSTEQIEALPSPRVINCHYPVHLTPREIFTKGIKIIHVQRNPKDIAVSYFNHIFKFSKKPSPLKTFSDFLPLMLGSYGIDLYYPWCKYVKEWEKFSRKHPDQILNMNFEDVKENPIREIRKVNEFLGTKCSDELIADISEACEFENLKKADAEVKDKKAFFNHEGPSPMYRKGEVGDWKNWFTVSESKQMDRWLSDNLTDTDLKFRYEL